jgi:hypothetical protein
MFDPANGPQAVALNEHGYCVEEDWAGGAQCCKERALVCPTSAVTGRAAKAAFSVAVHFDIVRADLVAVGARGIVTPLTFSFHGASFLPG